MTKADIRNRARERRKEATTQDRHRAGRAIARQFADLAFFRRAWRFCTYLALQGEIPTRYLIRACFDAGREVCVPAWDPIQRRYDLFAFDPSMHLVRGPLGIREPAVRIPIPPWDVAIFILPGLAFDTRGGRIGYGGGHFDRILAQAHGASLKVAVGFDWQVQDEVLPLSDHDIRVDWILTESRAIDCRANRAAGASDG
jgi:5-formyltetrahydrofolate cyclo-ligase